VQDGLRHDVRNIAKNRQKKRSQMIEKVKNLGLVVGVDIIVLNGAEFKSDF